MYAGANDSFDPATVSKAMDDVGPRSTKILSTMLPMEDKKELLSWVCANGDHYAFTNTDERRRRASLTVQREKLRATQIAKAAKEKELLSFARHAAREEFDNRAKEREKVDKRESEQRLKSDRGSKAYYAKTVRVASPAPSVSPLRLFSLRPFARLASPSLLSSDTALDPTMPRGRSASRRRPRPTATQAPPAALATPHPRCSALRPSPRAPPPPRRPPARARARATRRTCAADLPPAARALRPELA